MADVVTSFVLSFVLAVIAAFCTDLVLAGIFNGFQDFLGNWNLLSVGVWWLVLLPLSLAFDNW